MRHCARREKPCRVRGKGSNLDQPLNETNTKADKTRNDEQQQKRLSGNSGTKRGNPRHSGVDEGSHSVENISHRNTPLDLDQSLNETDTEADKGHNDKGQNKRIIGDSTNKRANPRNRRGNKGRNIAKNSSNSDSRSRLKATPFRNKLS